MVTSPLRRRAGSVGSSSKAQWQTLKTLTTMCFRGILIEMVIAEPDAVVDDNPVVAAADAADLRDLQGPDYFENVAQEQQGPTRRQRRQPARFRDDPTGLLDN